MDNYVLGGGRPEYIGKRLSSIPLKDLHAYFCEMQGWDRRGVSILVNGDIMAIREYLEEPTIAKKLHEELHEELERK